MSSAGPSGAFDATVQECSPCGKGQECVSAPCAECSACQPGFYKPSASADACSPCPADSYNARRGAQDLSACQPCPAHASTQGSTAQTSQFACICDVQYVLVPNSLFHYCLSCPKWAFCSDGSCFLNNLSSSLCSNGDRVVGYWTYNSSSELVPYQLYGCAPGYFLISDQCQICPTSFYCLGGALKPVPCSSDQFSLSGARNMSSCFSSVFVVVVINVLLSKQFFFADNTSSFQNSLAQLARTDSAYISIDGIDTGADHATTDITFKIATLDAEAASALSSNLSQTWNSSAGFVGLNGASLISVLLTACVPGYELQSQSPSTCQLACPLGKYCLNGEMYSAFSLLVDLQLSIMNSVAMTESENLKLQTALAAAAGVDFSTVKWLNSSGASGDVHVPGIRSAKPETYFSVSFQIDCKDVNMASRAQLALDSPSSTLNAQIELQGMDYQVRTISVRVRQCGVGYFVETNSSKCKPCTVCDVYNSSCGPQTDAVCNYGTLKVEQQFVQNFTNVTSFLSTVTNVIPVSIIVSAVVGFVLVTTGSVSFSIWWRLTAGASRRLIKGPIGALANQPDLPRELRERYIADCVLGFGAFGVVIKVKEVRRRRIFGEFAVKLIHSVGRSFTEKETRKCEREVGFA